MCGRDCVRLCQITDQCESAGGWFLHFHILATLPSPFILVHHYTTQRLLDVDVNTKWRKSTHSIVYINAADQMLPLTTYSGI